MESPLATHSARSARSVFCQLTLIDIGQAVQVIPAALAFSLIRPQVSSRRLTSVGIFRPISTR
jgi:hypothetical protein